MTDISIPPRGPVSPVGSQPPSLESTFGNRLKAAIDHARRLTKMQGCQSIDVAIAWETVEELQTAQSRYPILSCQFSFDHYCANNPQAVECRSYEC